MTATSCCPLGSRYWALTTLAMSLVWTAELPAGFQFDQAVSFGEPRPSSTMNAPTPAPRTMARSA